MAMSPEIMTVMAEVGGRLKQAGEFDTRVPHWFGATGDRPVEIMSLLGKHGERAHVRGAPSRKNGSR